jgi:outer membrane protein assembly factor BamB
MIQPSFRPLAQAVRAPALILLVAALGGCSMFGSGPAKPQPAELQPVTALVVRPPDLDHARRPGQFPVRRPAISGSSVAVASGDGTVALLDAQTGRDCLALFAEHTVGRGRRQRRQGRGRGDQSQ